MRKVLMLSIGLLLPLGPVGAQEVIAISESDCLFLEKHVPDADVTYRPGIDVNGDPVVPADLNEQQFELPEVVNFDLLVGLPLDDPLRPEGSVGKVSVNLETAQISLNGRPLSTSQYQAVIAYCKER